MLRQILKDKTNVFMILGILTLLIMLSEMSAIVRLITGGWGWVQNIVGALNILFPIVYFMSTREQKTLSTTALVLAISTRFISAMSMVTAFDETTLMAIIASGLMPKTLFAIVFLGQKTRHANLLAWALIVQSVFVVWTYYQRYYGVGASTPIFVQIISICLSLLSGVALLYYIWCEHLLSNKKEDYNA